MSASESIPKVRMRISLRIAQIESRAARLKTIDIGARMAAIRSMAA